MSKITKISAIIFAFVLVFGLLSFWARAGNDSGHRYLIKSDSGILKAITGVRWNFDHGYTAELTPGQAEALERLGARLEPISQYHILVKEVVGKPAGKPGGGSGGTSGRIAFPSDQTPWGIEKMYNNAAISSTSGGSGVKVAVLDTGVMTNHIDLAGRTAQCKDFTSALGIKNGCKDGNGHGTHVAGTILATGGSDAKGIYGMAPQALLYAYKVCGNSGLCWADDIATAIRYAADQGAHIISMSLGSDVESALIRDAITYAVAKGVLVVAAAGNDGPADGSIDYPGANADVVAVGAIDVNEHVPDWSSRGVNDGDYIVEVREVEFGAPGVAVESTWNDGTYKVISGTSMATPHISGLAAKLWQGSAAATRTYLQSLAKLHDLWIAGDDTATGFGLPQVP